MWPWGHLAVGYLLYAIYTRYRFLDRPSDAAVVAVVLGSQFPDIVDKPLSYWWLLPEGRTLAHSIIVALPLCIAVWWLARRARNAEVGVAFVTGYLSHLAADTVLDITAGSLEGLSFLAWPLLDAPDYEASGFNHHLAELEMSVQSAAALSPEAWYFVVQTLLFAVMLVVWAQHRFPPLGGLWTRLRGTVTAEAG